MSARIIPFDYDGQAVRFNADGWINATEAATRFGKLPHEWLRLPETVAYLEALAKCGKIPQLVRTQRGRDGCTWLHPKLAVAFARWLSVDFAVWCDEQVDALLRGESKPWANARREAAIGHKAVCDAIAFNCEAQGKTPQRHHFINEARLNLKQSVASKVSRMYRHPVAANSATGFDGPIRQRRTSAPLITIAGAFFMPAVSCYGGCARETFGSAGLLCPRSVNLRTAATLIRLTANRGSSQDKGAVPVRHTTNPPVIRIRAAAHRAMAIAALHADSSLSVRLKRYNAAMAKARTLENVWGAE